MSQFGKLNSRIIWVGVNEYVLRSAAKKDWGVLTLNSARCSFEASEFLPFLCKVFSILHDYKVSLGCVCIRKYFNPTGASLQSARVDAGSPIKAECAFCGLTSQHPSLVWGERHVSSWTKFLISFLAKETGLSSVRAFCNAKQLLSMGMRRRFSSRTLLIKMKALLHIVFATSIHAIQTDCSTSSKLPGKAENISLCFHTGDEALYSQTGWCSSFDSQPGASTEHRDFIAMKTCREEPQPFYPVSELSRIRHNRKRHDWLEMEVLISAGKRRSHWT